jgi:hypothetical protein
MWLHGCTELVGAREEYIYGSREDNRWDIPAEGRDLRSLARKWSIPSCILAIVSGCEEWRELRQEYGRHFATRNALASELIDGEGEPAVVPARTSDQADPERAPEAQWMPELDPEERRRRLMEILEVRVEDEPQGCQDVPAHCVPCRACA